MSTGGPTVRAPAGGPLGELRLSVGVRAGRSVATDQYHRGPLMLMRPLYLDDSGQVCYVVINTGGGYLGGDLYVIDVEVTDSARLLLTTQSATKVYRTPGGFAEQRLHVRLGPGAALEYVPDQLIAYRQASYRQLGRIEMDPAASLVMSEVLTPGWSPDGEPFRYDQLRLRNEIWRAGRLLAVDNLLITPENDRIGGLGFMEGRSHLGSLLVVDPRVDDDLVDDIYQLVAGFEDRALVGLSLLAEPGFVLRALADETAVLNEVIGSATALLRRRWFGQGPLGLRKY